MQMASVLSLLGLIDTQTYLVAVVVFCLVYYLFFSTSHELPPGPRAWPIVGNLLDIKKYGPTRSHIYYADMQKKYGNVYKIYFGGWLMVVVNGYEAVHEVLVKQGMFLSYRPVWLYGPSQTTKDGRGLIWGDGEEWKQLRRMTLRALRDLGVGKSTLEERIAEETTCLIDAMATKEGQPFEVKTDLNKAVANIIYSVAFGSRFEYGDPTFQRLINTTDSLFRSQGFTSGVSAVPLLRFIPSFKKHFKCYLEGTSTVKSYAREQIEEHRRTFDGQEEERDFVDIYLKLEKEHPDSNVFTDGNMTKCIMDLLLAGTETTAGTLDFGLLYMIKYPDVQHKCQKEIDKVVGMGRMVKLSDKPSLVYTEATIMEIQRMAAIASFAVLRTCPKDTWVGGYRIPRGCIIHTNIYSVLHDTDRWGDPHIFRPERFITPDRQLIHPETWIPFGGGPRMCVGEILARMELFLFFSNLMQRFHFTKADTSEPDIEPCSGMTMKPKPYELVLHMRF